MATEPDLARGRQDGRAGNRGAAVFEVFEGADDMRWALWVLVASLGAVMSESIGRAGDEPNYDESKVPSYELPDPLKSASGRTIISPEEWRRVRRPEILKLFTEQMYGRAPKRPEAVLFEESLIADNVLGGKGEFRNVRIWLLGRREGPAMDVLLVLPKKAPRPVPAFVAMNFRGNASTHPHPKIPLSRNWMRNDPRRGFVDHRMTEKARGVAASRWPYEQILDRGYAVATVYYGDVDPDFDDGFQNGIHPWFYRPGQRRPAPDEWGSIAAWAWGLSRIMDYLERQDRIDPKHVAVMGHSRLGKTALWAGATDSRFGIVISNNSGCGGAALSRRRFGETVRRINTSFPHWFCENFKKYNDREDAMPFDQHMLLALIAPRPVLVCSAEEDRWADPRGEFLSCLHADPVYRLLGTDGLGTKTMPPVHRPVLTTVGYHIRAGKHDVTALDWKVYCDFADRHWKRGGESERREGAAK